MHDDVKRTEQRALQIGMAGNAAMGAAGVLAAVLSNSHAILLDGLFSLVGFFAALIAIRVGRTATAGPDRARPFGYALDESIFATFRSLSLLVLVAVSLIGALVTIADHVQGATRQDLRFDIAAVYFGFIGATCLALWIVHYLAWRRTGRSSAILRLEARAALFDGAITAAAGVGMGLVYLLSTGPYAAIAPIGDPLIVVLLCAFALIVYWKDFRAGLAELAGVSVAGPPLIAARRQLQQVLSDWGGTLIDVALLKAGRTYNLVVYVSPERPVTASEIDTLAAQLIEALAPKLGRVEVLVVVTRIGRRVIGPDVS